MTNLFDETLDALVDHQYIYSDIVYIGSFDGEYEISLKDFEEQAQALDYYDGYGAQHIASDLIVLFKDGNWLSRYEYDGSENWVLNSPPKIELGVDRKSIHSLGGNEYMWESLSHINDPQS